MAEQCLKVREQLPGEVCEWREFSVPAEEVLRILHRLPPSPENLVLIRANLTISGYFSVSKNRESSRTLSGGETAPSRAGNSMCPKCETCFACPSVPSHLDQDGLPCTGGKPPEDSEAAPPPPGASLPPVAPAATQTAGEVVREINELRDRSSVQGAGKPGQIERRCHYCNARVWANSTRGSLPSHASPKTGGRCIGYASGRGSKFFRDSGRLPSPKQERALPAEPPLPREPVRPIFDPMLANRLRAEQAVASRTHAAEEKPEGTLSPSRKSGETANCIRCRKDVPLTMEGRLVPHDGKAGPCSGSGIRIARPV